MDSLDLYARIEPYIGFYNAYETLYKRYMKLVEPLHVRNVLDIGCGNGKFLLHLQNAGYEALGIERSAYMVAEASKRGVKAQVREIATLEDESFDCACAIGDVLNYMTAEELDVFFLHVRRILKPQGFFLADVNTLEGFEVADGVMSAEDEAGFLNIEANFEDNILATKISFFEKKEALYTKHQGEVLQYFHPKTYFKKQKFLTLQKSFYHSMFSDAKEKEIMIFEK